ncbi:MAG: hypothetical protein KBA57_01770 [Sphingomonadaceae bacterium]|nr:hypothetical protein [Sphingomonadaceae bacterium]
MVLAVLGALCGCATMQNGDRPEELEYACGDLAVIGRIRTVDEKVIAGSQADFLPHWRSEFSLQIQIRRIIRGMEHRRFVPASIISHAQIRDDRDFLIVLRPNGLDGYTLQTASLWKGRSKLKEPCL